MSLRIRLTLLITLLFILIMIGASIFIITNARKAIFDEVQSTATLTLQLVKIALTSTASSEQAELQDQVLEEIALLEDIRHLHIELYRSNNPYRPSRQQLGLQGSMPVKVYAPDWYTRLVEPPAMEFHHSIDEPGLPVTEIIIRANPADEITESWNETRGVLVLLVLFVVLANLLVYVTLGRGFRPIETILKALEGIEHGDYKLRLPTFNLPELSRISSKFNLMAEVLQKSQEDNRYLTQRSLAIQEEERRNLAYELHDELGQSITAIKAVATSIEQKSTHADETTREGADTIISLSSRMYDVAKTRMQQLRPPALDELGLRAALQDMIDNWNARHQDIFCYFSFNGDIDHLGDPIDINIYRIIQESLTNIIKHARASSVNITLSVTDQPGTDNSKKQLELDIEDDGQGFNIDEIRPGLGLMGMRERAQALDGTFSITSGTGNGTRINIIIPLKTGRAEDD